MEKVSKLPRKMFLAREHSNQMDISLPLAEKSVPPHFKKLRICIRVYLITKKRISINPGIKKTARYSINQCKAYDSMKMLVGYKNDCKRNQILGKIIRPSFKYL